MNDLQVTSYMNGRTKAAQMENSELTVQGHTLQAPRSRRKEHRPVRVLGRPPNISGTPRTHPHSPYVPSHVARRRAWPVEMLSPRIPRAVLPICDPYRYWQVHFGSETPRSQSQLSPTADCPSVCTSGFHIDFELFGFPCPLLSRMQL